MYLQALDYKLGEAQSPFFDGKSEPQQETDYAVFRELKRSGLGEQLSDDKLGNLKQWYERMKQKSNVV